MLYFEMLDKHPADKPALIFKDTITTYGQLREKVDSWAAFLQEQGVQQGDRVGLLSKNCDSYVVVYLAVTKIGAVIVPLNFQLAPLEVAYIVKDAGIKTFISKEPLDMQAALAERGVDWEVRQYTYEDFAAAREGAKPVVPPMKETDNCTIIYTSGTTGNPKGAMLCHKGLLQNAASYIKVVLVRESDIAMCVLPMYHAFGWTYTITGNLMTGGTIVIQENYIFKEVMNQIAKYKINTFGGVPTMMQMFYKSATPEELAGMRFFISGGAACPVALSDGFYKKFGKPIQEGYGLSEASPIVAVNPGHKIKAGSIGLPLPGITVQIQDENGNEVEPNHVGELCVRGENVMLGYFKRPEDTAYALRNGWLHTEDLAYKDDEGYIFIVDRLKDMIISSGENVYPREVEEIIYSHPAVSAAAVIGIPDKLRGQAVCAYLVLNEGATLTKQELRKYLLARIAPYKVPREYVFVEQLPMNNTGKVLKRVLRDKAIAEMVNKKR